MSRGIEATKTAFEALKTKVVVGLAEGLSYHRALPVDAVSVEAKADVETLLALQRQVWWHARLEANE